MKVKACHCCGGSGKENDHVLIGSKMKSKRKSLGLQQKYVALKLGISPQFLSDLEQGRRYWSQAMIRNYDAVLNQ